MKQDKKKDETPNTSTSVIHVRVGRPLAEEIRRVAIAERISVRAVVERLLNSGLSPSADDGRSRHHQPSSTLAAEDRKATIMRMSDPTVRFLLGELWEGWALFTMNASFLPDAFGSKLAKVKTLFAYEKLLQMLGVSAEKYPLEQAIADAFNEIWSGLGEQPSSKTDSGTIE